LCLRTTFLCDSRCPTSGQTLAGRAAGIQQNRPRAWYRQKIVVGTAERTTINIEIRWPLPFFFRSRSLDITTSFVAGLKSVLRALKISLIEHFSPSYFPFSRMILQITLVAITTTQSIASNAAQSVAFAAAIPPKIAPKPATAAAVNRYSGSERARNALPCSCSRAINTSLSPLFITPTPLNP
jgi:hypothetical protein